MDYTKTPWTVTFHKVDMGQTLHDWRTLYQINDGSAQIGEVAAANTRVMEAAPKAYESLRELIAVCRDVSYTHEALRKAREVVAAIEGKV